jgi:hypothetical protein
VQLAEDGDTIDDATVRWPEERPQRAFGESVCGRLSRITPASSNASSSIRPLRGWHRGLGRSSLRAASQYLFDEREAAQSSRRAVTSGRVERCVTRHSFHRPRGGLPPLFARVHPPQARSFYGLISLS